MNANSVPKVETLALDDDQELSLDMSEEPIYESRDQPPGVGSKVVDFECYLANAAVTKTRLSDLLTYGPVLVNFIKGTWCPFCQTHLRQLSQWKNSLKAANVTILVLSNEKLHDIQAWLKNNSIDYPIGSIANQSVFAAYGVSLDKMSFAKPATFLIEPGLILRMAYVGPRDERLKNQSGVARLLDYNDIKRHKRGGSK